MSESGWNWRLLRCGGFRLDGGSMFGMVPRAVWTRFVEPDERNMIPLQQNSLLLERDGRIVLIETGIGDKFGAKERGIYAMEERSSIDAMRPSSRTSLRGRKSIRPADSHRCSTRSK